VGSAVCKLHFEVNLTYSYEVGKAVKGGQEAVKVLKTFKIGNLADFNHFRCGPFKLNPDFNHFRCGLSHVSILIISVAGCRLSSMSIVLLSIQPIFSNETATL